MTEFRFIEAWRRNDAECGRRAMAFWTEHRLVVPEEQERRTAELCTLVYAGDEMAGLSTVVVQELSQLRGRFAFFRCAVAPKFRRHELAIHLTVQAFHTVGRWARENPSEKVLGLVAVIQGQELMGKAQRPMWPDHDVHLNLIRYTPRGEQLRLAWFPHVLLY